MENLKSALRDIIRCRTHRDSYKTHVECIDHMADKAQRALDNNAFTYRTPDAVASVQIKQGAMVGRAGPDIPDGQYDVVAKPEIVEHVAGGTYRLIGMAEGAGSCRCHGTRVICQGEDGKLWYLTSGDFDEKFKPA